MGSWHEFRGIQKVQLQITSNLNEKDKGDSKSVREQHERSGSVKGVARQEEQCEMSGNMRGVIAREDQYE
jgi:hypothetical protein